MTYPLSFPSIGVQTANFRLQRVVSSTASSFTLYQQVYKFPGEQWQCDMVLPPLARDNAAEMEAFLVNLYGSYGTFLFGDPHYLGFGARGPGGGTPLVNGAGQTGNSLIIDGCPHGITWLKKSDYFQLGSGATARLYKLTADAVTDGSGNVTLAFAPALRTSPADNDPLTITSPMGVMRLMTNKAEWAADKSVLKNFSFSFMEHIDV